MYYSYVEFEYIATSFSPARTDLAVKLLSYFWEVNKRLVRKTLPISKTCSVLQKLEGFSFATALDLNMAYFTIRLDPDASKICTNKLPWGKYSRLSMLKANTTPLWMQSHGLSMTPVSINIRSRNQGDIDGTSRIVLPCPSG